MEFSLLNFSSQILEYREFKKFSLPCNFPVGVFQVDIGDQDDEYFLRTSFISFQTFQKLSQELSFWWFSEDFSRARLLKIFKSFPGLLKNIWLEVAQPFLDFFFDFRETEKNPGVVFFSRLFNENVNFLRNFPYNFHEILQSYSTHPKSPPRVKIHQNRMNGMWATQSKWAQNWPKNRLVSTFFHFLKNSSVRFFPTFLLKFQISQIHCRIPLRWTVSQRGSHILWFLGYITWSFLQTLLFLVNASTTFNERG